MNSRPLLFALCSIFLSAFAVAEKEHLPSGSWAEWVEPDFPFFSTTLDARKAGPASPPDNLIPRGLVLNLGHGCWACFDTDLLRVAAVWDGQAVTPESLCRVSYSDDGMKTLDGQTKLPLPDGRVWMANGIYPGWQSGDRPVLADPREPAPSPQEVGRGALPADLGRFRAVQLIRSGARLDYTVAGVKVREWMAATAASTVERRFAVDASAKPLVLVLGIKSEGNSVAVSGAGMVEDPAVWAVELPPHREAVEFRVAMSGVSNTPKLSTDKFDSEAAPLRWPQLVTTQTKLSEAKSAYVVDDIALPVANPWKRNVRLADLEFFPDGSAAGVTTDGDVWIVRGLGGKSGEVTWKRFTSGLHEPMSLAIRDGQIFVFDRNGLWLLRDADGNGEADAHELFSAAFTQTAETREFPSSMKLPPDGSFVISKGGQQSSSLGKHNGMVLRVSPDGEKVTVLGWGFRGPFIGVHPRTGLVTASDQEGNYVPTTPLYIVEGGTFHGFLSPLLPQEKYPEPIADPLLWIPHPVNSSGLTQAWLTDPRMGPLDGSLLHIGYTKPELFLVLMNHRFPKPQAAIVSFIRDIEFPPLNAAMNPADGQLYVSGYRGWGTTATRSCGLARIRYTGAPCLLPREVVPMDQGVLLRFDVPLDPPRAADLASYSIERWNYQRTYKYGSPHLKLDGTPGQDWMQPSSVYLAKDGKSVFIGVPDMKPVMQMRVGWSLTAKDGATFEDSAYLTPYALAPFQPAAEGFGNIAVDLTPKAVVARVMAPASADEGRRVYNSFGCAACHSTDGTMLGKVGPSWKGLFGSDRKFADGSTIRADETYLKQSILEPSAKVVKGFEKAEAGMPIYGGVLNDSQLESLVMFIKTLR